MTFPNNKFIRCNKNGMKQIGEGQFQTFWEVCIKRCDDCEQDTIVDKIELE